jgi:hypothetical protein
VKLPDPTKRLLLAVVITLGVMMAPSRYYVVAAGPGDSDAVTAFLDSFRRLAK